MKRLALATCVALTLTLTAPACGSDDGDSNGASGATPLQLDAAHKALVQDAAFGDLKVLVDAWSGRTKHLFYDGNFQSQPRPVSDFGLAAQENKTPPSCSDFCNQRTRLCTDSSTAADESASVRVYLEKMVAGCTEVQVKDVDWLTTLKTTVKTDFEAFDYRQWETYKHPNWDFRMSGALTARTDNPEYPATSFKRNEVWLKSTVPDQIFRDANGGYPLSMPAITEIKVDVEHPRFLGSADTVHVVWSGTGSSMYGYIKGRKPYKVTATVKVAEKVVATGSYDLIEGGISAAWVWSE